MTYAWKDGSQIAIDAELAGAALEKVRERHQGQLTPEVVLKAAESKKNPLHGYFEWDDTAAARKYRIEQAKYLIRSIVVKYEGNAEPRQLRAYVSVKDHEAKPKYVTTETALGDAEYRQQVLAKAWAELQQWRRRYEELREFAKIFAVIDNNDILQK